MTQPDAEQPKTADELGAGLAPKHRQFADAYLSNGLNLSAASREAKYRNGSEGFRLMQRSDISSYVQARLTEVGLGKAEITRKLEYLAAGDMRDFLTVAETERSYWMDAEEHPAVQKFAKAQGLSLEEVGDSELMDLFGSAGVAQDFNGRRLVLVTSVAAQVEIDWRGAERAQALGRVKKIKVDSRSGAIEFELHDPVKTLELLGKAQKMFTDKVEHSGSVDMGVKFIAGLEEGDL